MPGPPLIGITADLIRNSQGEPEQALLGYCSVVEKAGGVPLLLPFVEEVMGFVNALDGWLIAGGKDVPPEEYGQVPAPETEPISEARYRFETRLWDVFAPTGKPILGICYGCQFINVRLGGTLYQHLPVACPAAGPHSGVMHPVTLQEGTLLTEACGSSRFECSSSHHQAIADLGRGLRITARADDGIVEGIEASDERWLVGVQWHPERTPDSPATKRLLTAFVEAAERYGSGS